MTVEKNAMGKCSRHECEVAVFDVVVDVGGIGVAVFMSSIPGSTYIRII